VHYNLPQQSTHHDQVQNQLVDSASNYSQEGDVILAGDFNARTGTLIDYIVFDDMAHLPLLLD